MSKSATPNLQTCVKKIQPKANLFLCFFFKSQSILKLRRQSQKLASIKHFQTSEKSSSCYKNFIARCVFVYTTFQVADTKTILPFEKGEKLRNLFFLSKIGFKNLNSSKLFFFNLPRFQTRLNCSYLAHTA